jgi:hypothetical protein
LPWRVTRHPSAPAPRSPTTRATPADAIIPGAHLLADADQGRSGLAFAALVALIVPAPLLGLVWAYLDQGGVPSWCGATALCATLAIWLAAIRGSDPT